MINKMKLDKLPLKLMNTRVSHPDQASLDKLVALSVAKAITKKYPSPEDRADAFDGAFTGLNINNYISQGASKYAWINELLAWYNVEKQQNLSSPFYHGLKISMSRLGIRAVYDDAINYLKIKSGHFKR